MDQYLSSTQGHLQHTKGKNLQLWNFPVAHCLWISVQSLSLSAIKSLLERVKLWLVNMDLSSYFALLVSIFWFLWRKEAFLSRRPSWNYYAEGQTITFSGSGAWNQNGITECSIQTVVSWTRTMLLNAAIHWPEVVDLQSWQFAIQSVYLWNFLLHPETKLSPLEYVSQDTSHLQRLHLWGWLTFVLDPRSQEIPSYDKRGLVDLIQDILVQNALQ